MRVLFLQRFGLSQLREGASNHSLRSILCAFTLLFYNTYVSLILGRNTSLSSSLNRFSGGLLRPTPAPTVSGTGEGNLAEAEALLEPYQEKYPKVRPAGNKRLHLFTQMWFYYQRTFIYLRIFQV